MNEAHSPCRPSKCRAIRAFLERDFPPESLPSVEEARALVADLRKAREQFAKAQGQAERLAKLEAMQGQRRLALLREQEQLRERHRLERAALEREQLAARQAQKGLYLARARAVRAARLEARPTGLAAFLGRVTGVSLVINKLHRHRDAKAYRAFDADRQALMLAQKQAAESLQRRQEMQALDGARQLKALGKVEARERQALDVKLVREQRIAGRHGHDHMPALNLDLKPRGRGPSMRRAKDRYRDRSGREEREAPEVHREEESAAPRKSGIDLKQALEDAIAREEPWSKPVDLAGDFARAADDGSGGEGSRGGDEGAVRISRAERRSERRRGRDDDFERER